MLTDEKQAEAYAFLLDGIETLNEMLNVVESGFIEEDWDRCKKMGEQFQGCKETLEP
jgi:hypothetical protein